MRDRSTRALLLVLGGLLAMLVVAMPLQAGPRPQDVFVTNTAADPVPVAVQGTPTVRAEQQGAWNVALTNTAATPVPTTRADDPAKQPVQTTGLVLIGPADQGEETTLYTVPAGKRLVLEQASARAQLFSGVRAAMIFIRALGPGGGGFYLPLTQLGTFAGMGDVAVGSQFLRGYGNAGTKVDASVTLDTAAGSGARIEVTIAGYLVDV